MAKNRSKRHHYVPQCIQRHFRGPEGKIWYAERTDGVFHVPEPRNTKSCFCKKDLNTTIANGNLSDEVEDAWGRVDDEIASMLKNIHEILGRGRLPDLTSDALENLRFIAAMLMTRSPEIAPPVAQIEQRYISKLEEFAGKNGEQSDECRVNAKDPVRLRQLVNHIRAVALGGVPKSVLEELNSFFPTWAIVHDKSGFILGSKMIYPSGNGELGGLKYHGIEL